MKILFSLNRIVHNSGKTSARISGVRYLKGLACLGLTNPNTSSTVSESCWLYPFPSRYHIFHQSKYMYACAKGTAEMTTSGDTQEHQTAAHSIQDVEGRLASFQDRLVQYGKEMFGEDFALGALAGSLSGEPEVQEPTVTTAVKFKPNNAHVNGACKKRENAKTVLHRFLEDREELVRLRVITKAANEKMMERVGAAENRVKQLGALLCESERRRRADVSNSQAFLTELRKKLTSVERTQRRLLAVLTRPDDEILDRVLERQARKEAIEVRAASPGGLALVNTHDDDARLEDTLSKLSLELREIEQSMELFSRS